MKKMKKMLFGILYIIAGLLTIVILFLFSDFIFSRIPAHHVSTDDTAVTDIHIYLLSNDVHMDLVFPVKSPYIDWQSVFPYEHTLAKDGNKKWVAIGWGDKGFYLNTPEWEDLSLKTALVAGLGIGESALHVTYYDKLEEDDLCRRVRISEEQYRILVEYVLDSMEKDGNGDPIYIETTAQYGPDDTFYEALGSYNLFYSCNTWTNNALKAAKLPAAVWTVFDKGILRHYPSP